ncbi:uncharacterized protein PHACADRAFT_134689 [Phanerochaete carnosa HHB-10118-sp]|uniref:Uncharacterized protein n=1 Tax=Phanerochaete carnosa (strain HHB-10118-sp) TaxID=650164 RepID=K5XDZ1_PHACS|nr:uncharacterized protein PHACADRAFT_134689 [Phanerochaete carnosa HHB-10118-sp]EKM61257.1 hypothetical protein PHACADRAFT_134689 [Phanerochaete carnosa HHB-10118-sp]
MAAHRTTGMNASDEENQRFFQKLKPICVPLVAKSHLAPSTIPEVSSLLTQLIETLRDAERQRRQFKPSLISYIFFPISSILRRTTNAAVPDQVLEKLLTVLSILCDHWWWDMDVPTWEQIFMLCSAITGGLDGKGKGKRRADEAIEAAAQCLWTLLRERPPDEDPAGPSSRANDIFTTFRSHSQTRPFIPILGQTVNSLLDASRSQHAPLQRTSLKVIRLIIECYLPDDFIPSILPGVVSSMCKIALATGISKRWANGETVALALDVIRAVTIRAIGDEICVAEGAVRGPTTLENLTELTSDAPVEDPKPTPPYATRRTSSWLRGTSSQLHIALNTLNPLVTHPSATALRTLTDFASAILRATMLTLPQSQPLLLSFLLFLSLSDFPDVSKQATAHLLDLCGDPARSELLQTLLHIAKDHLMRFPRLIPTQSDMKVEHSAGIVEAICSLGTTRDGRQGLRTVALEVSKLLGPNGGIERWGWSLLSVLDLTVPSITATSTSSAQLMLENDIQAAQLVSFPEANLRQVASRSAQQALERMFRALGRAAQEDGLFAVEWFFGVGRASEEAEAAAALWCGTRLLEGIAGVSLEIGQRPQIVPKRRRLEKFARWLAKALPELWDDEGRSLPSDPEPILKTKTEAQNDEPLVEHIKGLTQIRAPMQVDFSRPSTASKRHASSPALYRALALQSLAICAGILQTGFTHLLLYTLYPVLNALVSDHDYLSSTALATLHYISYCTSYASPANLLLSNFDYALDAVSRRLNRRWLDVDATRVLVVLVRLVGREVVQKAGDVVEECFDRLDEYHGYEVIVDGLVAVLLEVVVVIGTDEINLPEASKTATPAKTRSQLDADKFSELCDWVVHRHEKPVNPPDDLPPDFEPGSFPRESWGKGKNEDATEEASHTAEDPLAEPPPTPTQALTKLIVSRSLYFLTHGSAMIRARILNLLSSAVPVLPDSALLQSIHHAWPFILNRFSDPEPYVTRAAAALVEALATHVGDFMYRRVWTDIWPRFRKMLYQLEQADVTNALARRAPGAVGTSSAYTHSHRLYTAILNTLSASVAGVKAQNQVAWEVIVACRRFLHAGAHEELQACAVKLFKALCLEHEDAVWLALSATAGSIPACAFLCESRWDISRNMRIIVSP